MAKTFLCVLIFFITSWDAVDGCCSYYSSSAYLPDLGIISIVGFVFALVVILCCCCCHASREPTTDTEHDSAGNLAVISSNTAVEEYASDYPRGLQDFRLQHTNNSQQASRPGEHQPPPSYSQTQAALPKEYGPPPSYSLILATPPIEYQPPPSYRECQLSK